MSARRHDGITFLRTSNHSAPPVVVLRTSTVRDSRWPIRHAVRFPIEPVLKGTGLGYLKIALPRREKMRKQMLIVLDAHTLYNTFMI